MERAIVAAPGESEANWIARIEEGRSELEQSSEILRTPHWEWSGDRSDPGVLEETVGEVCRTASKGPRSAVVLMCLVRSFRPRICLELGTCVGVSTAYEASALELNGEGTLHSFEAASARQAVAERFCGGLGLGRITFRQGRFEDTLAPALEALTAPVDYAFIDGHHEEEATVVYFDQILRYCADGAVLVFDDIHWSPGMERAWERILAHERAGLAVDLRDMGICVVGARKSHEPVQLLLR